MIKSEPIIAVANVARSSAWYQKLLGCLSVHGGEVFEILANQAGDQILSLHKWGEHQHPTLKESIPTNGNGLILYFVVEDLEKAWENAVQLNARIEKKPELNPNSGRIEFSIRDLDNYYISICSTPITAR